jgi:hypothetical protein
MCLVGGQVLSVVGLRDAAGRCPPGARLRRALGERKGMGGAHGSTRS